MPATSVHVFPACMRTPVVSACHALSPSTARLASYPPVSLFASAAYAQTCESWSMALANASRATNKIWSSQVDTARKRPSANSDIESTRIWILGNAYCWGSIVFRKLSVSAIPKRNPVIACTHPNAAAACGAPAPMEPLFLQPVERVLAACSFWSPVLPTNLIYRRKALVSYGR